MCGILWVGMKLQREKEHTQQKGESVGEDVVICPGLKTGGPRHLELVPICPSCRGGLGDAILTQTPARDLWTYVGYRRNPVLMPDHRSRHKELSEAVFGVGDMCSVRWQVYPLYQAGRGQGNYLNPASHVTQARYKEYWDLPASTDSEFPACHWPASMEASEGWNRDGWYY